MAAKTMREEAADDCNGGPTDEELSQDDDAPLPSKYEAYEMQIAGHRFEKRGATLRLGVLRDTSSGRLLKPAQSYPRGDREVLFYKSIRQSVDHAQPTDAVLRQLAEFVPRFHGTVVVPLNGSGHVFLELDDAAAELERPCLVDVKVGAQTWDPSAAPAKVAYERAKYPWATQLGFRLLGMKVFDRQKGEVESRDRMWGRGVEPGQVVGVLAEFFRSASDVRAVASSCVEQLERIRAVFAKQKRFHIYSSSLLIAYDGAANTSNAQCIVKMIDFTHVFDAVDVDENYLFGLKCLIAKLKLFLSSVE